MYRREKYLLMHYKNIIFFLILSLKSTPMMKTNIFNTLYICIYTLKSILNSHYIVYNLGFV